jgi:O-antigen ligase
MRGWVFAFSGYALLSSLWSHNESMLTFQRGVSLFFLAGLIFLAVWPRLRVLKDYNALAKTLAAVAWATALVSGALVVAAPGYAIRPFTGAWQGLFGNPNMLGMVYAILLPVAASRFHHKRGLVTAALPAMLLGFLVLSQSRAGLLGGVFGVGVFYAVYYGKKIWIMLFLFLCLAVPFAVVRQTNVLDEAEQSILRGETSVDEMGSGRIGLWKEAYKRFRERPILGYGFGTAGDYYMSDGEPFRWHSSFTQTGVELGVIGLFFYILTVGYSGVKMAQYHLVEVRSGAVRALVGGFVGGWFGGMFNSFFESWFFSVGNFATVLAWMCFAAGIKGIAEAPILSAPEAAGQEPGTIDEARAPQEEQIAG